MRVALNLREIVVIVSSSIVILNTLVPNDLLAWQTTPPAVLQERSADEPAIRRLGADDPGRASSVSLASAEKSTEKKVAIRASSFQGLTPGETTTAQLLEKLGEPNSRETRDAEEVFTFQVGPFPKVEAMIADDAITSIIIYLDKTAPPKDIAKELKLDSFEAVVIRSESGTALGQVYPERGVVFSFDPDATERMVGQLILEQISAEPFLMRVRQDTQHRYERNLADLTHAQRYAPNTAELHWLKARMLEGKGSYRRALSAVEKAIDLAPEDSRLLTTRAAIHFELDDHDSAIADAETVIADDDVPPEYKARAYCQLADFMANGPDHEYNEALEVHQQALQMGVQLATTDRTEVRRYAKRVLVDAYFGVANDIARGHWQDKQNTMLKWLKGASEIAYGMLEYDEGESALRLQIIHRTLQAYAGLKANSDAKKAVNQLLDELEQAARKSPDDGFLGQLRWIAVETLYEAIEISRARGDHEQVLEFVQHADRLIEELDGQRERTPHSNYLVGKIYFFAGLAESVAHQNHQRAVRYYEKSLPYFSVELPTRNHAERGLHGERFVSMGVSYWQADAQDEAVNLTQRGLEMMVVAHRDGQLQESALAVPFGNLATMYKELKEPEQASRMAARASELESR